MANSLFQVPPRQATYVGCYADRPDESFPRALPNLMASEDSMTTEMCAQLARAAGFSFFGLQVGSGEKKRRWWLWFLWMNCYSPSSKLPHLYLLIFRRMLGYE